MMINGAVTAQSLFLHFVKGRNSHDAAYVL